MTDRCVSMKTNSLKHALLLSSMPLQKRPFFVATACNHSACIYCRAEIFAFFATPALLRTHITAQGVKISAKALDGRFIANAQNAPVFAGKTDDKKGVQTR